MAVAEAKVSPRLKKRYDERDQAALHRAVRLQEPRCRRRGSRRSRSTWAWARRSRTPTLLDAAAEQLATIAGQKPNVRRARKSIANFKLREGMPVGVAVTLRDARMWEFLDRLESIAIPRIRDFRGLNPRSFDGRGNYSHGRPRADHLSRDRLRLDRPGARPRRRRSRRPPRPTKRRSRCSRRSACRSAATRRRPRRAAEMRAGSSRGGRRSARGRAGRRSSS